MPITSPKIKDDLSDADVVSPRGDKWLYTDTVKDHFFNPRNLILDGAPASYDVVGQVGSPACGDVMKMWLTINKDEDRIIECKWQTFGCGSAIAATSMYSVMLTENGGMIIEEALKIGPQQIMERLGGLPTRKVHCSVLADKAFREAIQHWFMKSGQEHRLPKKQGVKVLDPKLGLTEEDVEEAVLHGARTLDDVQQKTKICTGFEDQKARKSCMLEVEQLTRFYVEKFYG